MLRTYLEELSIQINEINNISEEELTNDRIDNYCTSIRNISQNLDIWNKDRKLVATLHSVKNVFLRRFKEENVCLDGLNTFIENPKGRDEYIYDSDYYRVKVGVRFPEIVITNSNNESHTIKELYIHFSLLLSRQTNVLDVNLVRISDITARRGVMSRKEIALNYIHSHISSWGGNYCEGQLSEIKSNYNGNSYNEDNLEGFLISFESGIKWESLEGGPHKRINNLKGSSDVSLTTYSRNHFNSEVNKAVAGREIFRLLKKYPNYPLPITILGEINQVIEIDYSKIDDFHNYIRDLALNESRNNNNSSLLDSLVYFYSEGTYYRNTNSTQNNNVDLYLSSKYFIFKGQKVQLKLQEEIHKKQNNNDDNTNYKIPPEYIEHFLKIFGRYCQLYHKING